jgi:single-strand DNA-binding protein
MINKVILVGRLGVDPEIKATSKGDEYANFSLATSKKIKTKDGTWQEKTTWHKITTFDPNLTKTIKDYVTKGTMLYLEGEIDVSEYTDSNGNKKYNTSIIIPRVTGVMKMLGGKGDAKQKPAKDINDDLPNDDIPTEIPF